jgi:hypothetical protein
MLTRRPCGVCVALVPASTGCAHWRGAGSKIIHGRSTAAIDAKKKRDRERRQRIRDETKARVEAFQKQMGVSNG